MRDRLCFLVMASALVVGCAQMRWDKPGEDAHAVNEQFDVCLRLARRATSGVSALYTVPTPKVVHGPFLGSVVQTPLVDIENLLRELERTDRCMREQGYRLVPAEAAGERGQE